MALAEHMKGNRHTAPVPRNKPDNHTVQTFWRFTLIPFHISQQACTW